MKSTNRTTCDSDRNFRLVQQAIATIFKQSDIAAYLRKITVDVRNGNWSASVVMKGEPNDAASAKEAATRRNKQQKGSQTIRIEFQSDSSDR